VLGVRLFCLRQIRQRRKALGRDRLEDGGRMADDRRLMTEDGGRRSEDGSQ
jgi:hypothetical protein